ncbi:hypothetical protein N658DRAFT_507921 [Parathielavia hyrcaniae]|uniref:Uncharacterized protein n=1 Tax=Parathielavia hyrcaniae TaxID=113614 RepID=A0AAN6T0M2_9PEZI|nr:hypothetical protein N658DRAFT_507921 [Parathielavia hyrcaniae]
MSQQIRFSILVVTAAILAARIAATAPASSQPPPSLRHRQRDEECGFAGNSDLYGLGICLGVYLQWISSLVVWAWYPEGSASLMQTYLIFLFAIMIVVLVSTLQDAPLFAGEIVVLTYIVFGGVYSMIFQTVTRRKARPVAGPSPIMWLALFSLLGTAGVYCSWFWLGGLHGHMLPTPCGTHTFFFTKVSVYEPAISKFFGTLSILFSVSFVPQPLLYLSTRIGPLSKLDEEWKLLLSPWTSSYTRESRGRLLIEAPIFSVILCIYPIIAVELILHWNSIRDVYTINTTGQLIPFTIALTGFVRCIYKSIEEKLPMGLRSEIEGAAEPPPVPTEGEQPDDAATVESKPKSLPNTAEVRPCGQMDG